MESSPSLNSSERKLLRGKAMNLAPAVMIGKQGLTPSVLNALNFALAKDGLIKIKFTEKDKQAREALINQITEQTHSTQCGIVGKTASIYRPKELVSDED